MYKQEVLQNPIYIIFLSCTKYAFDVFHPLILAFICLWGLPGSRHGNSTETQSKAELSVINNPASSSPTSFKLMDHMWPFSFNCIQEHFSTGEGAVNLLMTTSLHLFAN